MSNTAGIELLHTKTLAGLAQAEIARLIQVGELRAGVKLSEISLTERLKVSRAAIREAFRALEEAGLVRLEKNRGVFVREFERAEAIEIFEMRAWLEATAAERLASMITESDLSELTKLHSQMQRYAQNSSIERYYPLNVTFHDRLVEMTRHGVLLATYRRIADQSHLLRREGYDGGDGLLSSHREHEAIIEALRRRDPKDAAHAARFHALNGMGRYLESRPE